MDPVHVEVEAIAAAPVARRALEVVERKGLGHPDTICDAVAEAVSTALCRAYLERAGRVLHFNADKALLVAGQSVPALGGGRVSAPMRLILGDRATAEWEGRPIPVDELAEDAARRWVGEHLRFVDPDRHLVFESTLRPGSAELSGLYTPGRPPGANDTSAGVGHAPASETEELVLAAERLLNAPDFKRRHPAAGEDVKVMAVRRGRRLELTVAVAVVDRFVETVEAYVEAVRAVGADLHADLAGRLRAIEELDVRLNVLDDPARGPDGLYLTVLGTSAEGADGGEVGRGNRADGLIAFGRPSSLEAVAGKNPTRHVGKIYNVLAHDVARAIHGRVDGVEDVTVVLVSRIGHPLDEPWLASAQVVPAAGAALEELEGPIRGVFEEELGRLDGLLASLVAGERRVY